MIGALIGGVIGAIIGGGVWIAIGFYSGYEIGWLAWGIGALVGVGVHMGGKGKLGMPTAVLAAALAAAAVAGGKYAVLYATIEREFGGSVQLTEENVISFVADDVIVARIEGNQPVNWPSGVDPNDAWVEADYPPDVWADAVAHWESMSQAERDDLRAEVQAPVDTLGMTNALYTDTFGVFDLLWFALAIGSAYKIGNGDGG